MKASSTALTCVVLSAALLASPSFGAAGQTIEGKYCGKLWSGGVLEDVVTTLSTTASGLLTGSYEFSDRNETTQGALLEHRDGDDARTLIWTDQYGTGQLVIRFDQGGNAFTGNWGAGDETPQYRWDGAPCSEDVAGLGPRSRLNPS